MLANKHAVANRQTRSSRYSSLTRGRSNDELTRMMRAAGGPIGTELSIGNLSAAAAAAAARCCYGDNCSGL